MDEPICHETVMDPAGDVTLIAGDHKFLVSSKALGFVCQPLKAMMNWPQVQEGDESFQKTREVLLEDDPTALEIILNIAHLRFGAVPETLDFEQLLSLAVLTDKYQATQMVKPWLAGWTADFSQYVNKPGFVECSWIAWEFGLETDFDHMASYIVRHIEVVEGGGWMLDGEHLAGKHIPPGLIERVLELRHVTLERLLDVLYGYKNRLEDTDAPAGLCKAQPPTAGCNALALGSLMLGLRKIGLDPSQPRAEVIPTSVYELWLAISKIKMHKYRDDNGDQFDDWGHSRSHDQCNIQRELEARGKKVLENMPRATTAAHDTHVQTQKALLSRGK